LESKLLDILDYHFVKEMRMNPTSYNDSERGYDDSELTIRFILSKKYEHIRVLIRNWKDNKAFSKNLDLKLFNTQNPPSVIRLIRESVYNFSGVESRDFLNQWYEKKRIELRQDKLNDLGI
jgi:hypothetical protein